MLPSSMTLRGFRATVPVWRPPRPLADMGPPSACLQLFAHAPPMQGQAVTLWERVQQAKALGCCTGCDTMPCLKLTPLTAVLEGSHKSHKLSKAKGRP